MLVAVEAKGQLTKNLVLIDEDFESYTYADTTGFGIAPTDGYGVIHARCISTNKLKPITNETTLEDIDFVWWRPIDDKVMPYYNRWLERQKKAKEEKETKGNK